MNWATREYQAEVEVALDLKWGGNRTGCDTVCPLGLGHGPDCSAWSHDDVAAGAVTVAYRYLNRKGDAPSR